MDTQLQTTNGQSQDLSTQVISLISEKNSDIDNALMMNKFNMIIAKTPKILSMDAPTIAQAMLKAMIPDPTLQDHDDIYFVPYGRTIDVSFSHNYLQKLAYRNGAVKMINTYLIYEGDIVEITEGGLKYKVLPFTPQGEFLGVLVDIKLANGERKYGTVTKEHIDSARKASKSGNDGPWKTWYYEMAKKVALKNTLKGLDVSPEFSAAVTIDNEDTDFSKTKSKADAGEGTSALESMMKEGSESVNEVEDFLLINNIKFEIKGDWIMVYTADSEDEGLKALHEKMQLITKDDKPGMLFGKISELNNNLR